MRLCNPQGWDSKTVKTLTRAQAIAEKWLSLPTTRKVAIYRKEGGSSEQITEFQTL